MVAVILFDRQGEVLGGVFNDSVPSSFIPAGEEVDFVAMLPGTGPVRVRQVESYELVAFDTTR